MIAVFTVLLILSLSIFIVRVGTVGLALTGISKDMAQFQALSAFTGSGFTTQESEKIVNHPLRRRIAMHLMLLGNAGIVVAVTSMLLSFLSVPNGEDRANTLWFRGIVLMIGILALWLLSRSKHIEKVMWHANAWAIRRWGDIELHDYTKLLRLAHDYVVLEQQVQHDAWVANHTLAELQLASEGVVVLGIERADGSYIGAPRGRSRIAPGDCLVMYGQQETLIDIDSRPRGPAGDARHADSAARHQSVLDKETPLHGPTGESVESAL